MTVQYYARFFINSYKSQLSNDGSFYWSMTVYYLWSNVVIVSVYAFECTVESLIWEVPTVETICDK